MFYLRPHHINCIYFFRGKGYSNKFIKDLKKSIVFLEKNPNEEIQFLIECDKVCEFCPRKKGRRCTNENKVSLIDKRAIDKYNLKLNEPYTFNEIKDKFYKNFDMKKFKSICFTCDWYTSEICSTKTTGMTCDISKDEDE